MKANLFIEERYAGIRKSLQGYCRTHDPEALHRYRVEIKKLKAFCALLHFASDRFKLAEAFTIHQKMYRRAAKIRSADVLQQLLRQYPVPERKALTFTDPQKQTQRISAFCKKSSTYLRELPGNKKYLMTYAGRIDKAVVRQYQEKLSGKILDLLKEDAYTKNLHRIRMYGKDYLYLSKFGRSKRISLTHIEELQLRIGDWHDQQLLCELLTETDAKGYAGSIKALKIAVEESLLNIALCRALLRYK